MYLISTIAGSGEKGHRDGIGKEAKFNFPFGIIISQDGKDLFVVELGNMCVRKVSIADGTTSTVAGIPGIMKRSLSASSFLHFIEKYSNLSSFLTMKNTRKQRTQRRTAFRSTVSISTWNLDGQRQ